MADKKDIFIVSHTHWDREWYLTREKFRLMLVELIDNLLDILDRDSNFKAFMLDGQTIVLEDYFEIRPENKERLKHYIQNERIMIGPWYVLPDELLVSGEAHIRNYIIGDQVCEEFGKKMDLGYLPDSFGHPSQIPQIINGLGMKELIFWRGVGPEVNKTEFNWVGPDGSQILAINMPFGYGIGACMPKDKEHFIRRFKNEVEKLSKMTDGNLILLMNGVDHIQPQAHISDMLKNCETELGEFNLKHTTMKEYVKTVKNSLDKLETVEGELRSTKKTYLLGGTLSTRMYLKQENYKAEQLIEKWVEPMATLAWTLGKPYPSGEIKQLWKYALSNLPHDSICGCSIDEVHEEMMTRYKYIKELGEGILDKTLNYISDLVPQANEEHEGVLVIFNPLEHDRSDIVEAVIDVNPQLIRKVDFDRGLLVEHDIDENRKLPTNIFIYDTDGNKLNSTLISAEKVVTMKLSLDTQPEMYEVMRLTIAFKTEDVKAIGFNTYLYDLHFETKKESINKKDYVLENEYFRVVPNLKDGTLDITDKRTNKVYEKCNRFLSGGDAGDEYTYSPPLEDSIFSMEKDSVRITWVENSNVRQVITVEGKMELPKAIALDRKKRNSEKVSCPVSSTIAIYPGVARIDITSELENNAEDHRLRVAFPTGIKASFSEAEGIFSVDKRVVTKNDETDYSDWIEAPCVSHPHKTFVDVNDGKVGLAIANRGIAEFEVYEEQNQNTIALTLLRCVGWLSRPDLLTRKGNGGWTLPTPGAQCKGKYSFEYSIIPHEGNWHEGNVHVEAHNFSTPLKAVVKSEFISDEVPYSSLMNIDNNSIVLSALKKAEKSNSLVVRCYNSSSSVVEANIKLNFPSEQAFVTTLDEKDINELEIKKQMVKVSFNPWEIKTLRFKL